MLHILRCATRWIRVVRQRRLLGRLLRTAIKLRSNTLTKKASTFATSFGGNGRLYGAGEESRTGPIVVAAPTGRRALDTSFSEGAQAMAAKHLLPTLEAQLSTAIAHLIIAAVMISGAICIVYAPLLLLHQWLSWWQAFGIAGVAALSFGIASNSAMKPPARQRVPQAVEQQIVAACFAHL